MENKENKNKIYLHESLIVGIILSLVGGILDAHTFLFRNGVFANTQTGNIVILGLFLNSNMSIKTTQCILSIISFIFGVLLTEFIKTRLKKRNIIIYIYIVISIEFFFITVISTIPQNMHNTAIIVIVSFVCSLQTNAFRSLRGSPYSTTMCTGNLRSASSSFFKFVFKKNKSQGKICLRYFVIILSFFFGAAVGKFLTHQIKQATLLVCSCLLMTVLIILFLQNNILRKKTNTT